MTESVGLKDNVILMISHEAWSDLWFSKHHYANALCKDNTVFFIEGERGLNPLASVDIDLIKEGLFVLRYSNVVPFSGRFDFLNRWNDFFVSWKIRRRLRSFIKNKAIVFWSFDPQRFLFPNFLQASKSIYHMMDAYRVPTEKVLVKNVDSVIVVSPDFGEELSKIHDCVSFIDHAVPPPVKNLKEELCSRPYFLLVGNLNYRVDFGALLSVAQKFSEYDFKIVGPVDSSRFDQTDSAIVEELEQLENVSFEGIKKYFEVERLIANAIVCFASYKSEYTYSQHNSLKIMQYLNYGVPVVSTIFEAYKDRSDVIFMGVSEDFRELTSKAIKSADSSEDRICRLEFSKEQHYPRVIERIEEIIYGKG